MKTDPSEPEIQHAVKLLREIRSWEGGMAIVPIDARCAWDQGQGPCGEPLAYVSVLLQVDKEDDPPWCDALALCPWHTVCMKSGLDRWRRFQ